MNIQKNIQIMPLQILMDFENIILLSNFLIFIQFNITKLKFIIFI